MFLNAIVIVAKEVIESAMVTCLLIALVRLFALPRSPTLFGFALGITLATLYGNSIDVITPWWDYRGQELVMVAVNCLMIALILLLLTSTIDNERYMPLLISLLIGLSFTLEISEIGIYVSAYRNKPELLSSAITGSVIGACIGISLAVLVFYTLMRLNPGTSIRVIRILFALLAGGLLSQSVQLLSQVDLLSGQTPVWDSSVLLSEDSIVGQLMVALLRYEARPTWLQVIAYTGGIALAIRVAMDSKHQKMQPRNPR
jgi:high-affinity iron transporter